MKYFIKLYQ